MQMIQDSIFQVSQSQATVLVRGESGTGKELVARAIHQASDRRKNRFVSVHCAAVPEALIESTLFGYERGAFTGATQRRVGRLEQANGGTLFLDEVGDIPLSTQVKLLRVLQEREFERVGGHDPLSVDVRVIAATHRDLEVMVMEGSFREDLYYRLNVVPIAIPPLRDRPEDIPVLLEHFLERCNRDNKRVIHFKDDVIQLISAYHWPGNIRELHNCVERLVVMATTDRIALSNIPEPLKPYFDHMRSVRNEAGSRGVPKKSSGTLSSSLDAIEEDRLKDALRQSGGVKAKAGRILGLTPRQVAYKMQKYHIAAP
jgi:Nif-specific regulatory protein